MNPFFQITNDLTDGAKAMAGAVSGIADLATGIKSLVQSSKRSGGPEVEAAVNQLLLAVENARLQNRILEIALSRYQEEVHRAQEAQADLARYERCETPAGYFVLRLKDAESSAEPTHFICPKCYEERARSILQGGRFKKSCKKCGADFAFEPRPRKSVTIRSGWMQQ